MDVELSQLGQNVALQYAVQETEHSEDENSKQSGLAEISQRIEETHKVSNTLADSNKELDSSSVNIENAVAEISEFVQAKNRQLDFSIDEKSQRSVVKVTDSESGDVIRQIPSEEILALSERIKDLQSDVGVAVGVLFNKQA